MFLYKTPKSVKKGEATLVICECCDLETNSLNIFEDSFLCDECEEAAKMRQRMKEITEQFDSEEWERPSQAK